MEVARPIRRVDHNHGGPDPGPDLAALLCPERALRSRQLRLHGDGVFFRGFRNNSLGNGRYVIDYPPGSPVDACASCWVFADLADAGRLSAPTMR